MAHQTVICTYRARPDAEDDFRQLLARHWQTLRALEFVTEDEPVLLRSTDEPTSGEIFPWVDGGIARAHTHPDVLAIWEPMEPLLEERGGRPRWEFPHFQPVTLAE